MWKEEEPVSEQRDFFQEKENHGAVSFQQPGEQYTPWKDVEIEEETPQVADDRPTTWAEALRRKQNLANGMNENVQEHKGDAASPLFDFLLTIVVGPAKPKLVAKTFGSDTSPWKIKRDAPKISAKDVPGSLRPLMSCALWRLHESIDRNDANELFLLSDQTEIRTIAQRLNISIRSTKELDVLIAAKAERVDLEAYGALEREFGPQPVARKRSKLSTSPNGGSEGSKEPSNQRTTLENGKKDIVTNDENAKVDDDHLNGITHTTNPNEVLEGARHIERPESEDRKSPEKALLDGFAKVEGNVWKLPSTDIRKRLALAAPRSPRYGQQQADLPINGLPKTSDMMKDSKNTTASSTEHQKTATVAPKAELATILSSSDTPIESPQSTSQAQVQVQESSPAPTPAKLESSKAAETEHEPEDSDEEIVVFVPQPKRFSNQKKPVQQNSRPSTPTDHSKIQTLDQKPQRSPATSQSQLKPPSRGRNPVIANHSHSQPTSSPTIIDPDAFGRSFAVNPNPGPRTLHNPRSHHRPKRSAENTHFTHSSPNAHQHKPRPRPSSQSLRNRSPRISPAPEPTVDKDQSPQRHEVQRTSPQRRLQALEPEDVTLQERGPNHANSDLQEIRQEPKSLSARMIESEEFVPRSALTESQFGAIGTPLKNAEPKDFSPKATKASLQVQPMAPESQAIDPDSFVSRNSESITQHKSRVIEPQVASRPNGFVPRNAMPIIQKRRTADLDTVEPRGSMPDIQYVLKSGSTRAATRGRGRLWTPS